MRSNICKLCKKESVLRHSHILPEFFYLSLYDESHRTLEISLGETKIIQKGLREYLFCQECETKLSRYENYAATLIRQISKLPKDASERFLYSNNMNYSLFKLFQLSILWRASISTNFVFKKVTLGTYQKEIIRQMLNEEKPGKSTDYGCIMMIMLNTEILHKVLIAPIPIDPNPFGGFPLYKFAVGSITWLFFASSYFFDPRAEEFFVQENGTLKIWLATDEKSTILNIGKILHDFKKNE